MTEKDFLSAARLKEAFDEGFRRPPPTPSADRVRLIVIRVGAEPFVLRIAQIQGVAGATGIRPVPGGRAAMLGWAGIEQRLVAVYDLASLLGVSSGEDPVRWMALCGAESTVGLGFAGVERSFDVASEEIYPLKNEHSANHVEGTVRVGNAMCPVVDISFVLESIENSNGRK